MNSHIYDISYTISMKNITKLQCDSLEFHQSFLIDLAQIVPHSRELSLEHVHLDEDYMEVLTVEMAIEHVQFYFKEVINLYLYMPGDKSAN